jgi:F0F1-type ATP synthase alpha subunit
VNGYFDGFPPEKTSQAEERLQEYLSREANDVLAAIRTTREINETIEKDLRAKLDQFVERTGE